MIKRKMSKLMILTFCLLMVSSVNAFAVSYNFNFTPPYIYSMESTTPVKADGNLTPYVDPTGTTSATSYFLSMPDEVTDIVSNTKHYVTSAKTYFTYNAGYGGYNQPYQMNGYPTYVDFQYYGASGDWKP